MPSRYNPTYWEYLKRQFLVSGSSIKEKNGAIYVSHTNRASAGGASGAATTLRTSMGFQFGTAGSATSSTPLDPPSWVVIADSYTQYRLPKVHLTHNDMIMPKTLCGLGRKTRSYNAKPHASRMCKKCVAIFKENVLGGRYEG